MGRGQEGRTGPPPCPCLHGGLLPRPPGPVAPFPGGAAALRGAAARPDKAPGDGRMARGCRGAPRGRKVPAPGGIPEREEARGWGGRQGGRPGRPRAGLQWVSPAALSGPSWARGAEHGAGPKPLPDALQGKGLGAGGWRGGICSKRAWGAGCQEGYGADGGQLLGAGGGPLLALRPGRGGTKRPLVPARAGGPGTDPAAPCPPQPPEGIFLHRPPPLPRGAAPGRCSPLAPPGTTPLGAGTEGAFSTRPPPLGAITRGIVPSWRAQPVARGTKSPPPLAGTSSTPSPSPSPPPPDLDRLLCDLRSFLLILDRESLSAEARAKKKSVAELLRRLQSPQSEDAEYMIMRCLSPSSGPPQGRDNSGTRTQDARGGRACERRPGSTQGPHSGSTSPSPPPDDSYEDTEPFGPGGRGGSGGADTDSSHYESYGEDEDAAPRAQDRAHYLRRPPAGGPPLPTEPPGRPEAQLCGFLWRKRWLGRWAKQLFIVREHALLGFRRAADPQPVLELELRGCRVASKGTGSKKLPRALKVTGPAGEALVIGFPSRQQAEDWRKALRLGSKEEEEREEASRNPGEDPKGGFLALRLRGRWRRLWCAVQGALRRFPEENGGGAPGPVCALLLDGCEVTPGPPGGSPRRLRIRVAQRGRELALLQARSEEEREAWLKTLRARGGRGGAAASPQEEPPRLGDGAGGLLLRRFPTPNAYMDDPSGHPNTERLQSLDGAAHGQRRGPASALPAGACSSTAPSQGAPARSRDFSPAQRTLTLPERKGAGDGLDIPIGRRRALPKPEEKVGQLERACRGKSRMKAGSEMNLLAIGKSLRGHVAATASSAASEGSFLSPLLRRTASARSALKRSPSAGVVEKGKVLQQRKEWEMKAAK
uniref:PH domain-containing protein n=1 Tax=Cairina moschata TaxID=8855 RepID=A0A8C3C1G3_CAIMO